MTDSATPDLPDDLTFEDALQRLEALVDDLERGDATLDASVAAYEEGVTLARYCLDRLDTAEMRVQELSLE